MVTSMTSGWVEEVGRWGGGVVVAELSVAAPMVMVCGLIFDFGFCVRKADEAGGMSQLSKSPNYLFKESPSRHFPAAPAMEDLSSVLPPLPHHHSHPPALHHAPQHANATQHATCNMQHTYLFTMAAAPLLEPILIQITVCYCH